MTYVTRFIGSNAAGGSLPPHMHSMINSECVGKFRLANEDTQLPFARESRYARTSLSRLGADRKARVRLRRTSGADPVSQGHGLRAHDPQLDNKSVDGSKRAA